MLEERVAKLEQGLREILDKLRQPVVRLVEPQVKSEDKPDAPPQIRR